MSLKQEPEEEVPLDECQFFDEPPEEIEYEFVPRTHDDEEEEQRPAKRSKTGGSATRRVYHNEVERQRRNKINTWITELGKLVMDDDDDDTKQPALSKIQILEKACQQLEMIKKRNREVRFDLKRAECELRMLRSENEKLKKELNKTAK
ncbi:upstream stimulatory factor 2-like [Culicoides brevitarsis]|uniref:upstream stimulatory factor 2-like n=1 Tax=Culicoides brevitarsis TaxID=469753 RepID=UPI00307C2102